MMQTILNFFKNTIIILLSSFFLLLFIDFFFGNYILKKLEPYISKTEFYERLIRIDHPIYHHTLKENINYFKARGFEGYYSLCTDNHGFKYKCNEEIRGKKFDYAFIGDSFTEGASVKYEDSYAGMFEDQLKTSVANMGVTSYAPYIYLSKLNYFLEQGFEFKHVIMFIDISDLYDDNVFYKIDEDLIVTEKYYIEKNLKRRKFLRNNFPFTNFYMFVLKKINFSFNEQYSLEKNDKNSKLNFHDGKGNLKASWTYAENDTIDGFDGSIKQSQNNMIKTVEQTYQLLKKNGITLSIVVYPWPHQLQNDSVNSRHVEMWKDFCENKCYKFINIFPLIFDEMNKTSFMNVYRKYYWWGDFHFNKKGNELITKELIKNFN